MADSFVRIWGSQWKKGKTIKQGPTVKPNSEIR